MLNTYLALRYHCLLRRYEFRNIFLLIKTTKTTERTEVVPQQLFDTIWLRAPKQKFNKFIDETERNYRDVL